jgi:hypothetical protein
MTVKKIFKAECMAQVVECLPSKTKALSTNPSTAKKRERKKER